MSVDGGASALASLRVCCEALGPSGLTRSSCEALTTTIGLKELFALLDCGAAIEAIAAVELNSIADQRLALELCVSIAQKARMRVLRALAA